MKIFTHLDEKYNKFIATTIFFYVHYFNERKKILKKTPKSRAVAEEALLNLRNVQNVCLVKYVLNVMKSMQTHLPRKNKCASFL